MKIPPDMTWTDRVHQRHKMSTMTIQHLKACLTLCLKDHWRLECVGYLEAWITYKELKNSPLARAMEEEE